LLDRLARNVAFISRLFGDDEPSLEPLASGELRPVAALAALNLHELVG
jgi:hypothetical protein